MCVRLFVLAISACALTFGADWATWRFDPQRTGWQRDERVLNARTVTKLGLLWKRRLSDRPNGLADPLILGPIITHRGIKELVLAKTSSDVVYAIDADLNRVFWSRSLTGRPSTSASACSEDSRVTPSMAPSVVRPKTSLGYENDFSDGNKPLYVLSGDGDLHAFRLRTGEDFAAPLKLLPDNARPTSMDVIGNDLYIATAAMCGGVPDRLWSVDPKTGFSAWSRPIENYEHDAMSGLFSARTAFEWQGKQLAVAVSPNGELAVRDAKSQPTIFGLPGSGNFPSLATWEDAAGNRWVYTNLRDGIKAFRLTPGQAQPEFAQPWSLSGLNSPGPPILANGILYFLSSAGSATGTDAARQTGAGLACPSGDTPHTVPVLRAVFKTSASHHLILHAVDALQGRELYNSGESICSNSSSKNLAIANGHISFSGADGWLYCFGIPFQM